MSDVSRAMRDIRRVRVPLGERSYDVLVGHGAAVQLGELLPSTARRAAVVSQPGLPVSIAASIPHVLLEIGHGEAHKSLATVAELCSGFADMGLTRNDVVIAVGGGMVTDVAGFAAATYHRGVPVVHVATTLLAMVDAAIGGKTGVNLPQGKNLVGAFWQPHGVVCDLDALETLSERDLRCGYGEMAKYHFLTGDDLLALPLDERIAACVAIKAEVVAADEHEQVGQRKGRATLNYGHTLAHALETAGHYDLRHGEAVAVGLVYAAELAHALGRIDADRVADHRRVVHAYGLADRLPESHDHAELVGLMGKDKKAVDGLTFALDGPDGVEIVAGVDPLTAAVVLERLGAAETAP